METLAFTPGAWYLSISSVAVARKLARDRLPCSQNSIWGTLSLRKTYTGTKGFTNKSIENREDLFLLRVVYEIHLRDASKQTAKLEKHLFSFN